MIFFKRISIFIFLLITVTGGFAQSRKQGTMFIRTNPLALIEPQAGPVVGTEFFVAKDFSIGVDVGGIFYNPFALAGDTSFSGYNPKGWRIKPEIRYYLKRAERRKTRLFVAVEGIFLKTSTHKYEELPVVDNMGNVVYTYLGGYKEVKKTNGASAKFGVQMPFNRKNPKRLFVEFYIGLGLKNKAYSYTGIPPGASIPANNDLIGARADDDQSNHLYPTLPAGLKLLWKL